MIRLEIKMDQYIIKGGKALAGEISVSGAKNAALGILAAAVMADETVTVENLPDIRDIDILLNAIASVGQWWSGLTSTASGLTAGQSTRL